MILTSEKGNLPKLDPAHQMSLLCEQGRRLGQEIYRDQALYLQVLRGSLLNTVRQTVFSLVTHNGENLLSQVSPELRSSFQMQIENLVGRCCSLLTVEQLMDLVRQMDKEQKLKKEKAKREILMAMNQQVVGMQEPNGSVNLSLNPPIEKTEYSNKFIQGDKEDNELEIELDLQESLDNEQGIESDSFAPVSQDLPIDKESDSQEQNKNDFDVLRSLIAMAGEAMGVEKSTFEESAGKDSSFASDDQEIEEGFLPENPLDLARWTESLELALTRRLRNLSHALNVEMLRVGIVDSLLPISALDAALRGQLDLQPVQANLLKLRVPAQNQIFEESMDILCVLLRSSEMEFDNPKLRRCRLQLKQHHTRLFRMVRQQRHWQSRFKVQEAHQQWWQTPPTQERDTNNR